MKQLKQLIFISLALIGVVATTIPASVSALGTTGVYDTCSTDKTVSDTAVCKGGGDRVSGIVTTIVNVLLFLLGAVSVIVIIVAGIRYATSGGNTASVTGAKNMLLYAIVGLVVAMLAYAIVRFVTTYLTKS